MTILALIAVIAAIVIVASFAEAAAQIIADVIFGDDFNRFPSKGGKKAKTAASKAVTVGEVETLPLVINHQPTTLVVVPHPALGLGMASAAPLSTPVVVEGTCKEVQPVELTQAERKSLIMGAAHALARAMGPDEGTYRERLSKALKLVHGWAKKDPEELKFKGVKLLTPKKETRAPEPVELNKSPTDIKASSFSDFIDQMRAREKALGNDGLLFWYLRERYLTEDVSQFSGLQGVKQEILYGSSRLYRFPEWGLIAYIK